MEARRRRAQGLPLGEPEGDHSLQRPAERAFEDQRPWPEAFERPGRQSHGPFEARQPRSRPFADQAGAPFDTSPAESDPFPAARSQDRPPEASRPEGHRPEAFPSQTGAFAFPGNDLPAGDEPAPPSRPPMETRRREPEPAERRRSRVPLLVTGVVVVLLAAAGAFVIMNGDDDRTATAVTPTTRPTAQLPLVSGSGDKYGFAASRKTDPQPLTLTEVFGRKKITAHGRSYFMTVRRTDKKCKNAVHGPAIRKALTAAGCTQVLRASFRDKAGDLIGTVGVANLRTAASAKKAAKAGSGNDLEDYVGPLQGKDAATKRLGSGGESFATAWPQGHYLVLLWFQYKDGHKPSKAEMKRLNKAAVGITEATVFNALDTRALTGARID